MEAFGQNIDFEFETILNEVNELYFKSKFMQLGMNASGEWVRNLEAKNDEIWGRDYSEYLAKGRPPNFDQDPESITKFARWAGATFIKKWVEDKGLSLNPYAVAYKIAREGTDYYPQGTDLIDVLASDEVISYINRRLSEVLVPKITNIIKINALTAFSNG